MIESLPSSTLKPPADENLKPDPRLTHFDADQTSPTEDDLEIIRHAAALARGRGQTNAEEVRGSYGTGAVARDVRRASNKRTASRVRAALPPELRMTSGHGGGSNGSERGKDTRRDSRRKSSKEDDTVISARSEDSKAMTKSDLEKFERDEGNMADDEETVMRPGKLHGRRRSVDSPKAKNGDGISGLKLTAVTIDTLQSSDDQALLEEEIAWQQTIQQQLRAEGMSNLGEPVAVKQQALEEQRLQMTASPPTFHDMASRSASASPGVEQHSPHKSAPEQQPSHEPEHMASEITISNKLDTLTAPPAKQQRYDFNCLARKIQASTTTRNSASAAPSFTPSPLPISPLDNPHPAVPHPQAEAIDQTFSTPDPSPAPPIPPRSPRRPTKVKDHTNPYPAGNELEESIRQHEMESAVAREQQQQQQQQGTFQCVSLSLSGGTSGGIGAGGAGGRSGGVAETAPRGVRAHEYEFGVLLEGLDDLEVLVGNSRGKRKGDGRLPRAEWRESRGCWVLFSVGQLEGLVRSAEVQGRESGRGAGGIGADGDGDGVAIGTVKYLGKLMRRVQEGVAEEDIVMLKRGMSSDIQHDREYERETFADTPGPAATTTTTTTEEEFPDVKAIIRGVGVVINSLDDITTLLRSSALLRRRGTAPDAQTSRRKAAGIWRIHFLEDLHALVALWEGQHRGVGAGSVGVVGAKGRLVLSSWEAVMSVVWAAKQEMRVERERERAREKAEAEGRWRRLVESHRPELHTPTSPGQQMEFRAPPPPTPRLAPAVTFGELLRGAKAHTSDVREAVVPESPRLHDNLEFDDSDDMDNDANDLTQEWKDLTAQIAAEEEEEDTVAMRAKPRSPPRRTPGPEYDATSEDPTITTAEATRARRLSEERKAEIEREVQARRKMKEETAAPVKEKPKREERERKIEKEITDYMASDEVMLAWIDGRDQPRWGLHNLAHEAAFPPQPQATRDQAKVEQYLREWCEDGGEALVPMLDQSGMRWRGYRREMEGMLLELAVRNEGRLEQYQAACEAEGGSIQYGPRSGIPMRLTYQEHEKAMEKAQEAEAQACENAAMQLEIQASQMRMQAAVEQQRRNEGM
ncbi:hypothetical protein LTS16_014131 [Friedmanniomyces endolithicus]|nr:hypothetical protein LTS16_014131 [Friedmanniomyces endolithicus]